MCTKHKFYNHSKNIIMKLRHLLYFLLMSAFVQAQTVVDIVVNSEDHNTLEAAVLDVNLQGTLSGDGPFTLFAPTDDAFAALPAGTVEALLEDSVTLTDILLYHTVGATALSTDLSDGQVITTVNGDDITITINADGVFINDAQVTMANIEATNGVVHVIDAVLLPPTNTVVDIISNSPDHNTLEAAIVAAGLVETLSGDAFTVFAPTDAAFEALPAGTVDALLADPTGQLTQILLYHTVAGQALSTDLADGQVIETILGRDVTVTINADGVFINEAQVTVVDLMADNGVVHVIDAVLLPPNPSIYDIVSESDVHNTLETLVDAAGLEDVLSGEGTLTLFAPTDDAFSVLSQDIIDALLADPTGQLLDILQYHATGSVIMAGDLTDGTIGRSLNEFDYLITQDENGDFVINANGGPGAKIVVTDIEATNGVVHVIDAIMVPNTTASIIFNSQGFSILSQLLQGTGLINDLNSTENTTTLFAPTDAAFTLIPEDILASISLSQEKFTDVLRYHVLGGRTFAGDLSDGQMITTLQGETAEITINADGVFINNAQIVLTDFFTGNGLIHIIDAVLLPAPSTVMDVVIRSDDHNILQVALDTAQLSETLQGEGTFTVFAPTDAAFENLPAGTIEALLANPTGDLQQILLYHVLGAEVLSTDLSDGQSATTLQGGDINVSIVDGVVLINNAEVIVADIQTENGVVHVIDAVLLPPTNTTELPATEANVYPSPATNHVTVDYNENQLIDPIIYIMDSAGKVVKNIKNVSSGKTVDVSRLENGIYSFIISDGKNTVTKRVTKIQ